MKFIKKLQKLPEKQKIIIIWSIIIVLGLSFSVWRISLLVSNMESIGKNNFQEKTGIEIPQPQEKTMEEVSEVKKGFDTIRESTDTIKEGFILMRNLIEEIEEMEEISSDDYPEFLMENND